MVLAVLFPWRATNLALKRCLGWDLALLKTPPLPLSCCSLELSLPSTRACPLPALARVCGHGAVGSVPLQRDELAAARCWSKTACRQSWHDFGSRGGPWTGGGAVTPNVGLPQHFQPAPSSTGRQGLGLLLRYDTLMGFTHQH